MGLLNGKDKNGNDLALMFHYSGLPNYPTDGKFRNVQVTIDKTNNVLIFQENTVFGMKRRYKDITLSPDKIYSAKDEGIDREQISNGLAGAVVGGALFGGTGAVTGSIVEKGSKKTKVKTFFVIRYIESDDQRKYLLLRSGNGVRPDFIKQLKQIAEENSSLKPNDKPIEL